LPCSLRVNGCQIGNPRRVRQAHGEPAAFARARPGTRAEQAQRGPTQGSSVLSSGRPGPRLSGTGMAISLRPACAARALTAMSSDRARLATGSPPQRRASRNAAATWRAPHWRAIGAPTSLRMSASVSLVPARFRRSRIRRIPRVAYEP
jgi:hypothetical protein